MTTARRILLVEDDRFLRRAAEAKLKQKGFTVFTAADGEEALRVAGEQPVDLILLDLILPRLPGFEVLRALKAQPETASTPVIVLSNLGQDRDVQECLNLGARSYFVKSNLSLDDLARSVDDVLNEAAS